MAQTGGGYASYKNRPSWRKNMVTSLKRDGMTWVTIDNCRRPMIYLDHCALRDLSANEKFQKKFLSVFQTKGTLCFSWMNFYDIGGNKEGPSVEHMKNFMKEIGENWFPIHWNPSKVMDNEKAGIHIPFADETFFCNYYPFIHGGSLTLNKAVELSLCPEVQAVRSKRMKQLESFRDEINECKDDPIRKCAAEKTFQRLEFHSSCPAVFVHDRLLSLIIKRKEKISNNDLIDFFHAVVSLSYADMVVLDSKWADYARQISIPKSGGKYYSVKDLERFLTDIERI